MADLMQQARELVEKLDSAAASWPTVYASDREIISLLLAAATTIESLREAALRAAPEGGVPERTMMALATGWRRHATSGGRGRAVLIQCAESLEAAVIAARPQGVKDAR